MVFEMRIIITIYYEKTPCTALNTQCHFVYSSITCYYSDFTSELCLEILALYLRTFICAHCNTTHIFIDGYLKQTVCIHT